MQEPERSSRVTHLFPRQPTGCSGHPGVSVTKPWPSPSEPNRPIHGSWVSAAGAYRSGLREDDHLMGSRPDASRRTAEWRSTGMSTSETLPLLRDLSPGSPWIVARCQSRQVRADIRARVLLSPCHPGQRGQGTPPSSSGRGAEADCCQDGNPPHVQVTRMGPRPYERLDPSTASPT